MIGEDQAQPEFPRLAQDRGEGIRGEILKFIHIQTGVPPLLLGQVGPAHGCELDARHEE